MVRDKHSSVEQRAERRFAWLLEDASREDLASIKNFKNVSANIYEYDPVTMSTRSPVGYAWQVLWLLGSHNTKHIFCSNSKPKAAMYTKDAKNFTDKIRWRVKLRGQEGASIRTARSRNTVPFRGVSPAPVDAWCYRFQKFFAMQAVKACKAAHLARCSNMSRLVRNALSTIKRHRDTWTVLKNDKDGGFSIVDITALRRAMHQTLQTDTYRLTEYGEFDPAQITRDTNNLCKLIAETEEEPALQRELSRPTRSKGRGKFVSRLQVTCKTHKDQGDVSLRPIHASCGYILAGPGKWLAIQIRKRLASLAPHLVRDSRDAAQRLNTTILAEPAKLGKLDLKDFFLSGSRAELVRDVMELWRDDSTCSSRQREVIKTVLEVLLIHQYVTMDDVFTTPLREATIYTVQKGTGMGLPQSGDISDGAFYIRCERSVAGPESLITHKIPVCLRFRDDILLMYEDFPLMARFIERLRAEGQYFRMEVEQVSNHDVQYLNLVVWRNGQRLCATHSFKPTSLGIPLSSRSCHHFSVHRSWPAAVMANIQKLSRNDKHFGNSETTFRQRFATHCTPTSWTPRSGARTTERPKCDPRPTFWCPLAYHPGTYRLLQRAVALFTDGNAELTRMMASFVFGREAHDVQIRMCWYNYIPNLQARLQSANGRTVGAAAVPIIISA